MGIYIPTWKIPELKDRPLDFLIDSDGDVWFDDISLSDTYAVEVDDTEMKNLLKGLKLYFFSRPGTMVDHDFSDDAAIVYAASKDSAIKKLSQLYDNVKEDEVDEPYFNPWDVAILTDY